MSFIHTVVRVYFRLRIIEEGECHMVDVLSCQRFLKIVEIIDNFYELVIENL